jgi:hypothetical protein
VGLHQSHIWPGSPPFSRAFFFFLLASSANCCFNFCHNSTSQTIANRAKGLKISGDRKSALFDVPADDVLSITQSAELPPKDKCGWAFVVATELPDFDHAAHIVLPSSLQSGDEKYCTIAFLSRKGVRAR